VRSEYDHAARGAAAPAQALRELCKLAFCMVDLKGL
jgi:hypothetical protein